MLKPVKKNGDIMGQVVGFVRKLDFQRLYIALTSQTWHHDQVGANPTNPCHPTAPKFCEYGFSGKIMEHQPGVT